MDSVAVDREIDRMAEEVVRRRSGSSENLDSVVWEVMKESEWFAYDDATEAETPFEELLDAIDTEPEQRVIRWAEGQPRSAAVVSNLAFSAVFRAVRSWAIRLE